MKLAITASGAAPFFSVILSTYQRSHLVIKAVESMLTQSFADWELLIIDDGSRDDTFEHLRPFVTSDPRIRYHFAQNRGHALARNLGAQMSVGEFITFLDSDDEYLPEHLKLRAEYLSRHPATELLHGGVEIIGPDTVADKFDPSRQIPLTECVIGGTFVIARSLVGRLAGFRPIDYGDDSDFFDRALEIIGATPGAIAKVDWPTYRYNRLENDSLCSIAERSGISGILAYRNPLLSNTT